MSRMQEYKCEVCGIQARDHSRWLLVTDEPRARNIDILSWDDKLAAQPGMCHLCCADHLQALVGTWMMPDLGVHPAPRPLGDDRSGLPRNFGLDPAYLAGSDDSERESLLAMLEAVEAALQATNPDDDLPQSFDA